METLRRNLDALYEKMMNIYETGDDNLETQIYHWLLQRKEHAILHGARKLGMTTLGMHPVPPASVSKIKAEKAIKMHMLLQSLSNSEFAEEPWSLTDTSLEMLETPPENTLKKGGSTVTVQFEGDGGEMDYILWKHIYVCTGTKWTRTCGSVDDNGIYYTCNGNKEYYVDFQAEAAKYCGNSGARWSVQTSKKDISSGSQQPVSQPSQPDPARTPSPDVPDRSTGTPQIPVPPLRRGPIGYPEETGPYRRHVGKRTTDRARGGTARRGPTWTSTAAAPVIIIKGGSNQLKCLRYRLQNKHRDLFHSISSTWSWTPRGGGKVGRSRITVSFTSNEQLSQFRNTAPLPTDVECCVGLSSL